MMVEQAKTSAEKLASLIEETRQVLSNEYGYDDRGRMVESAASMQSTIEDIEGELGDCESTVCRTVRQHAEGRQTIIRSVREDLESENPGDARDSLAELMGIVEEDISLLEGEGHERVLELERSLLEDAEDLSANAAQWQTLLAVQEDLDRMEDHLDVIFDVADRTAADAVDLEKIGENAEEIQKIAVSAQDRVPSGLPVQTDEYSDQSFDAGPLVIVDSVELSDGGFVALHDDNDTSGSLRGSSRYLEPGTHRNVRITVDQELPEGSTDLVAVAYEDSNGNRTFDADEDTGLDQPLQLGVIHDERVAKIVTNLDEIRMAARSDNLLYQSRVKD